MPLATLAPTIDGAGISAPVFADIQASLIESAQSIFGADAYLAPDSMDGQYIAITAAGINDVNNAIIAAFNSFRPGGAQGAGLSSIVKLSGISRNVASNSQVDVLLGGQIGTTILSGLVGDANGNQWALPSSVTIPSAGQILVTATCTVVGSIQAPIGSVTSILTPTLGWQTVTNPSAASQGAPVETDAELRQRQTQSVALPSLTVLAGIVGAVEALTGVTEVVAYENDTGATDANGLPPHSISLVVTGGDALQIATAIMLKKTPGAFTYGTTREAVVDSAGITHSIGFFVPVPEPVSVAVTIRALTGYSSVVGDEIKAAIAAYINALPVGQSVYISRLYLPAQLNGVGDFNTYELQQLLIAFTPASPGPSDLVVAFNGQATCDVGSITLTVV